jgi:WhiB family redox-sensing transcriptional regulator
VRRKALDMTRAACRDEDPELFFPISDQMHAQITEALAVCARCPIQAGCLAMYLDEPHGVVGGTTPAQRQSLRRALTAGAAERGEVAA